MTSQEIEKTVAEINAELLNDKPSYGYAVALRARLESAASVIAHLKKTIAEQANKIENQNLELRAIIGGD